MADLALEQSFNRQKPEIQDLKFRKKSEICSLKDVIIGHEIGMKRFGYKHHAVIIKIFEEYDTFEIVHISGNIGDSIKGSFTSRGKAKVNRQTISMHELGKSGILYHYGKASFPEDIVVRRANLVYECFNQSGQNYNAFTLNCQHLASYIVTGVMFSKKVEPHKKTFDREYKIDKIITALHLKRLEKFSPRHMNWLDCNCLNTFEVLFDFKDEKSDSLELVQGRIGVQFEEYEDGWSYGQIDGQQGYFPTAYVSFNLGHQIQPKEENKSMEMSKEKPALPPKPTSKKTHATIEPKEENKSMEMSKEKPALPPKPTSSRKTHATIGPKEENKSIEMSKEKPALPPKPTSSRKTRVITEPRERKPKKMIKEKLVISPRIPSLKKMLIATGKTNDIFPTGWPGLCEELKTKLIPREN